MSLLLEVQKMTAVSLSIRVPIIFIAILCSVQMYMFRSSYFKISSQCDPYTEEDFFLTKTVHDELSCATTCNANIYCQAALFDKDSKKCSLLKAKRTLQRPSTDDSCDTGKIALEKVIDLTNKKLNSSYNSAVNEDSGNTNAEEDQNHTAGTSCHDILQRNSSSPTGSYNISIGNFTWMTKCRMRGISGCGPEVWELIMKVKSSKSILRYDSSHWTSRASFGSVEECGEFKLPGYWLRNFTRICVTMNFTANASTNYTTILLNYSAQSLYSALHKGIRMALPVESPKITVPFGININCLEKGLNIKGPNSWEIRSRVGIVSKPFPPCRIPYLVRGVGIGSQKESQMSCGEIINSSRPQSFPAICRIYIQ